MMLLQIVFIVINNWFWTVSNWQTTT